MTEPIDLINRARGVVAYRVAAALDDDPDAAVMASEALAALPINVRDVAWALLVQRAADSGNLRSLLAEEMTGARIHAIVTEGEASIIAGAEALLAAPPVDPAGDEPDPEPGR